MTTAALPREATLIVNCMSRSGEDIFENACDALLVAGIKLRETHAIKKPQTMNRTIREAIASGVPMIILGGGDGSLSASVDEFVGHDCIFAILPLGTANSSARTLDIPLDLEGAVNVIANGRSKRIDLGMIGDDHFVNAAALGLSPMIGETVPHNLKRYLGRFGYLLWALKCTLGFRPFRLTLSGEDDTWSMWSTEVRILNGRFHGGVELSDEAEIDSGEIVVQVVIGTSKWRLLWDWFAKMFKLADRDAETHEFRGQHFHLQTEPALPISIDGEVGKKTPVDIAIARKAITVAVPSLSHESR